MKLFVLLPRVPFPLDKGDRLRAHHLLADLARRHEITLCCLAHETLAPPAAAAASIARLGARIEVVRIGPAGALLGMLAALARGRPLQVGYYSAPAALRRVRRLVAETRPDRLLFQLVRTAEYARGLEARATIDFMDAFSWGLEQRAEHAPAWQAPLVRREAAAMARYEGEALRRFPRASIVSALDRDRLAGGAGTGSGREAVPRHRVEIVGNGVDAEAFAPRPEAPKRHDILFVGNMAYPPNVLAAEQLVREVLPIVRRELPATLLIAGTSPTRRVRRLAGDGVEVAGEVPDIAGCYAASRVFVAPLPVATGLQNKLLQALAAGIPCVTSERAREALGASDSEMRVGRDAGEVAARTIDLLRDAEAARRLGERGRAFARRAFRWDTAAAALERLVLGDPSSRRDRDRDRD